MTRCPECGGDVTPIPNKDGVPVPTCACAEWIDQTTAELLDMVAYRDAVLRCLPVDERAEALVAKLMSKAYVQRPSRKLAKKGKL